MKHVNKCKIKKAIVCLYCLGFLLIFSAPGMAADPYLLSSSGSAKIYLACSDFHMSSRQ